LALLSPSLDSALRGQPLRQSKIAPGDFVASLTPTYVAEFPAFTGVTAFNQDNGYGTVNNTFTEPSTALLST